MKKYHSLLALFFIFALVSCENEIPFNLKENQPKLIVNAIIDIDDKEHLIYLAKTGKYDIDSIQNAVIHIYVNDELKEELTEPVVPDTNNDPNEPVYNYILPTKDAIYKTSLCFRPGDKVRIEVFAENNRYHAWAEDVVPHPVEIDQTDTVTYTENSYNTRIRLRTSFSDKPNEKNFYRLAVTEKNTVYYRTTENNMQTVFSHIKTTSIDTREDMIFNDGRIVTDDDLFLQPENFFAVFDDNLLNGPYTLTTNFYRPMESYYISSNGTGFVERVSIDFDVHLISITEMQHYYLKALNAIYSDNYDEYLSMPISIPSNVQGGTGLVGFSAGSHKTFSIPDIIPDTTAYPIYNHQMNNELKIQP